LHASKQDLYQQFRAFSRFESHLKADHRIAAEEADEDRRKEREHISVLSVDVEKVIT